MSYSRFPTPDLSAWQGVATVFRQRIREPLVLQPLDHCIDSKFMLLQAIRSGLTPGARYKASSTESLLQDLSRDVRDVLAARGVHFRYGWFGDSPTPVYCEREYLGLWCLVMEFATVTGEGCAIELTVGHLPEGTELEIGSDSVSLEGTCFQESKAFQFASVLLPIRRAVDLKCPLGGGAVQLDLPHQEGQWRRVA
jgi:hypothetical protein